MATTKSLFFTAALLLFVGIAMVNIQRAEAQCGGFRTTCGSFDVKDNGVLSAQCNDKSGKPKDSSINLNKYIGNINGDMIVPGVNFSGTCSALGFTDGSGGTEFFVVGECAQDDGSTAIAAYDVNSHISNDNGLLSWHTCP